MVRDGLHSTSDELVTAPSDCTGSSFRSRCPLRGGVARKRTNGKRPTPAEFAARCANHSKVVATHSCANHSKLKANELSHSEMQMHREIKQVVCLIHTQPNELSNAEIEALMSGSQSQAAASVSATHKIDAIADQVVADSTRVAAVPSQPSQPSPSERCSADTSSSSPDFAGHLGTLRVRRDAGEHTCELAIAADYDPIEAHTDSSDLEIPGVEASKSSFSLGIVSEHTEAPESVQPSVAEAPNPIIDDEQLINPVTNHVDEPLVVTATSETELSVIPEREPVSSAAEALEPIMDDEQLIDPMTYHVNEPGTVTVTREPELVPTASVIPHRVPVSYDKYGETALKILRETDFYSLDRTASDPRFWSIQQQDLYETIYDNIKFSESTRYIDWQYINSHEQFENIKERCSSVFLDHLMEFSYNWDESLVRQFFATVHIHPCGSRLTWITCHDKVEVTRGVWESVLGLEVGRRDVQIHNEPPLTLFFQKQLYKYPEYAHIGFTSDLLPLAWTANRLLRATIYPRDGSKTNIHAHNWNILHHVVFQRPFDIIDFIMREIAITTLKPKRLLPYAHYIMALIVKATGYSGIRKSKFRPYKVAIPKEPSIPKALLAAGAAAGVATSEIASEVRASLEDLAASEMPQSVVHSQLPPRDSGIGQPLVVPTEQGPQSAASDVSHVQSIQQLAQVVVSALQRIEHRF